VGKVFAELQDDSMETGEAMMTNRLETGVYRFVTSLGRNDWAGIWIRGDDALDIAAMMARALQLDSSLGHWGRFMGSCVESFRGELKCEGLDADGQERA
jgi:hypothetical protein